MCKLTTPTSVAWSQKAKCTNNLPRRARPTRVSPAAQRQTASDKQGHHGAKWQRHKLMKKRLGMGRSEDAPIVSEWGATKRRSEALQDDDTCETMIVAELQRLVFSLSIFSRHAAPHPLHSRISGYREALADDGRVPVSSSSSSSSTIAAETWRTKGSNKSTKILHRIGRLAAAGPVRSAETPRWPLFRASHFPLYPACLPDQCQCQCHCCVWESKVVLVVPRQRFQVDCVYPRPCPRPRPRSRPERAVFVDGSLGLSMAMSNCGRVVVALRPRKQRRGRGASHFKHLMMQSGGTSSPIIGIIPPPHSPSPQAANWNPSFVSRPSRAPVSLPPPEPPQCWAAHWMPGMRLNQWSLRSSAAWLLGRRDWSRQTNNIGGPRPVRCPCRIVSHRIVPLPSITHRPRFLCLSCSLPATPRFAPRRHRPTSRFRLHASVGTVHRPLPCPLPHCPG